MLDDWGVGSVWRLAFPRSAATGMEGRGLGTLCCRLWLIWALGADEAWTEEYGVSADVPICFLGIGFCPARPVSSSSCGFGESYALDLGVDGKSPWKVWDIETLWAFPSLTGLMLAALFRGAESRCWEIALFRGTTSWCGVVLFRGAPSWRWGVVLFRGAYSCCRGAALFRGAYPCSLGVFWGAYPCSWGVCFKPCLWIWGMPLFALYPWWGVRVVVTVCVTVVGAIQRSTHCCTLLQPLRGLTIYVTQTQTRKTLWKITPGPLFLTSHWHCWALLVRIIEPS